ncbi:PREDICTED: transcription initiation factor IIF subunit beta [Fragaria vesca subsp. vesca]|uniref:transcription initiation factor IIF subunit beta n=1 Tax=Fragaria vesca subsp. vesca TaxID=101020 RepID=UPI0002C30479|nr:PREDICTED: transcription initiation factor IIF subunit beta [Fragaria vesca subsp. vesca]
MEEKPSGKRVKSEEDHVAKKVKTEEDHGGSRSLDTGKADKLVWLMKLPQAVAKSWNSHPSSDPHPVAKVVLSLDPLETDETAAVQFKMEVAPTETGMKPKSYSMNMSKDFIPMCVFSEANQGKISVEGKVEHKFDMKPHGTNFEEYGKLCRERTNKSMIKNRQIQVIDNDRGVHMRPMPGMIGLISTNPKDKKKPVPVKQSDVKRTRRDRGELEDIMFKLFERQPNWALKQLVQETDQPAQFLKEILNELCVYNKRGTNQGTYELKPEYKKSVDDTPAE